MNNYTERQLEIMQNPVKTIRAYCLECCGGDRNEVVACTLSHEQKRDGLSKCPLYPFRLGKNPFFKRTERNLTDEQKQTVADRLRLGKEKATDNAQ